MQLDHPSLPPLAIVFAFATLNESIIEYLFGTVKSLHPYLSLLSLLSAIFLCFAYQVNVFISLLGQGSGSPFMDFLLSGFIISRVSNFVNDLVQKFLESK